MEPLVNTKLTFPTDESKWQAVVAKDSRAEGCFIYSVRTTGIYCRPTCKSRLPLRRNVSFHADSGSAECAGFRPCKRCLPNGPALEEIYLQKIAASCRFIERSEEEIPLDKLAVAAGMSRFHFHRIFTRLTGLTPKAWMLSGRAERLRKKLARGQTVTSALHDANFGSSGRFYEKATEMLGMKANSFRKRGDGEVIHFAIGLCSLGSILVAASEKGVCAITLGDDPDELVSNLQRTFSKATLVSADAEFEKQVAAVVGLVEAPGQGMSLPLDVRGTAFQRRVWQALVEIPPGRTESYAEIARRIGAPKSVRAVAGACAANLLAVAIPCHRVVRTDGHLSGYRWGVERKRTLLTRESEAQ